MTRLIFFVLLTLGSTNSFAQTQSEMNEAEHRKFTKADKELNQVYQAVLEEYETDSVFIKNIKISQRLWIQFRDAEMEMMYPTREPGYYGSIHPMCWSIYKTELTIERIKKLRLWLIGQKEGNPCSPSIKLSS